MSRPSKEQINGLITLVSQGQLQRALPQGEALVQQFPDVPFLLNLLGAINFGLGRLEHAVEAYRRVLKIKPDHAQAHNNLGIALDQLGDSEQAVASYRQALHFKPDLAEAHANLGNALARIEQVEEAASSYRTAVKLAPADAETQTKLGNALSRLERWNEASTAYFEALKLAPVSAETLINLGSALTHLDRWDEAATCYKQAITIRPDYAKAHFNLGIALGHFGRWEEAVASYSRALRIMPDYAEALYNLGGALDSLGRHEEAISSFGMALEIRPDYAEAHNNRGIVFDGLGRKDEAVASYHRALEIRPDYAEAHRNLCALTYYRRDHPHLVTMLELVSQPDCSDQDRIELSFALGKAYADIEEFDQAFAFYAEANRLQKQKLNYEISSVRKRFDKVVAAFSNNENRSDGTQLDQSPVFIVGMPRSGTTLVEQILASHSEVDGAGELKLLEKAVNRLDWDTTTLSLNQLQSVREFYLSGLKTAGSSAPNITDKMPFNFWWIGFILTTMPEAKIVHVKRDARAVCWSIFKHYFPGQGVGFSNDFHDLSEYYRIYLDLMEFWHTRFPGRIYDLDYETLTERQREETEKLLQFVGLAWEEQCLNFYRTNRPVRTMSAYQVREKMYQGSSDEWRNYRRHFEPMVDLLKDVDYRQD